MSIAFGGIVAFLFRGMNLLLALATVVFLTHQLTDDAYGVLVLGLTVVGITNAATGGLTAATAFQIANRRRTAGEALGSGGVIAGSLGLAAVIVGLVAGTIASGKPGAIGAPVGIAAAAVITNSVVAGIYLGRESFVRYNLTLVVPPLLTLICIAVTFLVLGERSPVAGLSAYATGQWLGVLAALVMGRRVLFTGLAVRREVLRTAGRFAFVAGISSGVSYLNYRADLFVVEHFEGDAGVATYSRAVYIAESVWQISGSLALATYARMGALDRVAAAELTTRVMRHSILMLGGVCLVLFAGADILAAVLFSDAGVASALRYILPGVLVYGLAQSFSGFYTYQRGFPWVSALVAGSGLAIDIAFDFILIPRMGVDGASLASTLAYSTAMAGALIFFFRAEHISPLRIVQFGRTDFDDYRRLLTRLRQAG
jgi:O-antigen/teichoic acid export membrane protein